MELLFQGLRQACRQTEVSLQHCLLSGVIRRGRALGDTATQLSALVPMYSAIPPVTVDGLLGFCLRPGLHWVLGPFPFHLLKDLLQQFCLFCSMKFLFSTNCSHYDEWNPFIAQILLQLLPIFPASFYRPNPELSIFTVAGSPILSWCYSSQFISPLHQYASCQVHSCLCVAKSIGQFTSSYYLIYQWCLTQLITSLILFLHWLWDTILLGFFLPFWLLFSLLRLSLYFPISKCWSNPGIRPGNYSFLCLPSCLW